MAEGVKYGEEETEAEIEKAEEEGTDLQKALDALKERTA